MFAKDQSRPLNVIAYDDFIALGSEVAAKKAGKYRLEGREYVVQDGNIVHFRFNV